MVADTSLMTLAGLLVLPLWHCESFQPFPASPYRPRFSRTSPHKLAETTANSNISSWLIENLEEGEGAGASITTASTVKAGENDTLPVDGLLIGEKFRILAASAPEEEEESDSRFRIRLYLGRNGWGTGVHPSTRLCLEWMEDTILGGETVLDYGCGSGILTIAASYLGASHCVGVDVEAEALVTTERNWNLNFEEGTSAGLELLHTRQIEPSAGTVQADICVANILIGQLVRPSMIAALVSSVRPGGYLCFSGIRPDEVTSLQSAYREYGIEEWIDQDELAAVDTPGSIDSYGFDCGTWSRIVGRREMIDNAEAIARMSEQAVS